MALFTRPALVSDSFPKDLAALFVERVDHEAMPGTIGGGVAVAVKTGTKRSLWIGADGARNEDSISPNDWTRVGQAGNRCVPENVVARLAVPLIGQVLSFGNAGSVWSTK